MLDSPNSESFENIQKLLVEKKIYSTRAAKELFQKKRYQRIAADGSNRIFLRIQPADFPDCIIIIPAGNNPSDLAESRSAWKIGRHLERNGVPVPKLYGWHSDTGVLVFEDLGDKRLHDITLRSMAGAVCKNRSVYSFYLETIEKLAKMQIRGGTGFEKEWCWDTPRYDLALMVEKESHYFLRAFWHGFLGIETVPDVEGEFRALAKRAADASGDYFLHRDFQCRNIMIKDNAVRFIDFQGGRLGPLGYDIASLLIDPYAGLSMQMQGQLLAEYIAIVDNYFSIDKDLFVQQFNLLAVQRNMQIIGAFSYLSQIKEKPFFKEYIRPALLSLHVRLKEKVFNEYTSLKSMVHFGLREMEKM